VRQLPVPRSPGLNKSYLSGAWRGVVEYNLDPRREGRCKVRIPQLHNSEEEVPSSHLPWARPIAPMGGYHDGGSFYVPPVGATVWVMFEQGSAQYPLYIGAWWKSPDETREMLTKTDPSTGKTLPEAPISMGTWAQTVGPETPQEILAVPYDPTTTLIAKSTKGHTVLLEDRDGYEVLRVIDRAGQEIRLSSPVDDFNNQNNAEQRGRKSAADGDLFDYAKLAGHGAEIEIVGTSGSRLQIRSQENAEQAELLSTSPDGTSFAVLRLSGGEGKIELSGGLAGIQGFRLQVDLGTGEVTVFALGGIRVQAESVYLETEEVRIQGDLSVDGDLAVRGDGLVAGKFMGG